MAEEPFRSSYPRYDVLEKWDSPSWNEATRRAVDDRLHNVPPRRFFSEREYALLTALVETVLPQPERAPHERIPVAAFIDGVLYEDRGNGTRFADALPQREAWRRVLAAIAAEAERRHGRAFPDLPGPLRTALLKAVDAGEVDGTLWEGVKPRRFFRDVLLKEAVKIYYAHPSAWNEIGFGGPAAPRGYVRLGPDQRDPWEAREERPPQPLGRQE